MKMNFTRSEVVARLALGLILAGLPLAILGYQYILRPALTNGRSIDIVVAAPERGGFQPEAIRVAAGEQVRLRFSAPDVTHGLAIGPGLGLDFGQVDPGQVKEVEVTFDQPGRYTLYCNTWCSPNHWRMRSTIEVYDPANPDALLVNDSADPVIASLIERGIDIDAAHKSPLIPSEKPSTQRGAKIVAQLGNRLPEDLTTSEWRRTHSPAEAYTRLLNDGLDTPQAWDVVAYLWMQNAEAARLEAAASLYAKNCAYCHGETGKGDGFGASILKAQGIDAAEGPIAFAGPEVMLGGSGDMYYAKIRRGGMGTGMPGFGQVFSPHETWALVDYLWTFVFETR
jgi:plastocyanin